MEFPSHVDGKRGGIYRYICIVNGKVYVGSAKHLANRHKGHKSGFRYDTHHGILFKHAWKKHGAENFVYELLEYVDNEADLIPREQYWMDRLGAYGPNGYNSTPIAGSMLGYRHRADTREAMSRRRKGRGISPQMQEASRLAWLGRKHTPETIEKMRKAKEGKGFPAHAQALGAASRKAKGYKHSEETKAKISENAKGRNVSPDRIEAMAAAIRGVPWTPERIAKRQATIAAKKKAELEGKAEPVTEAGIERITKRRARRRKQYTENKLAAD